MADHTLIGALCGLGGIGKSTVALEFAWTRKSNYKGVYWFHAQHRNQLMADYTKLSRKLRLTQDNQCLEDIALVMKDWFENSRNHGWLAIYDNAPNYDDISDFLPVIGGKILVTSRFSIWHQGQAFTLDKFSLEETTQFVTKALKGKQVECLTADIEPLAKTFHNLPLAIAQACAYIKYSAITINKYLEAYHRNKEKWLTRNELPKHFDTASVFLTWDVTMKKIEEKFPLAARWLEILAVLNADEVPHEMLKTFLKWNSADKDDLQDVLLILTQFSMIKVDKKCTSSMHRVLQEVIILKTVEEEKGRIILTAFLIISSLETSLLTHYYYFHCKKNWSPHYGSLLFYIKLLKNDTMKLSSMNLAAPNSDFYECKIRVPFLQGILTLLSKSDYTHAVFSTNIHYLKELIDFWILFFGETSIQVAYCSYVTGRALALRSSAEAIEYLDQSLRVYSRYEKFSYYYCVRIKAIQARLNFLLHGDYDRGIQLLLEAFDICERQYRTSDRTYTLLVSKEISSIYTNSVYFTQLSRIFNKSIEQSTNFHCAYIVILIAIECKNVKMPSILAQLLNSVLPDHRENVRKSISTYTTQRWKTTLLSYACFCHKGWAVKLLLDFGVDPGFQNSDGETALHLLTANCRFGSYVFPNGDCLTLNLLIDAIIFQNSAKPEALISILDGIDYRGYSPLRNLVVYGNDLILQVFLSKAAPYVDVNRKYLKGLTPAAILVLGQERDMLKILFKYGASATDRDDHDTILHKAVRTNWKPILEIVIERIREECQENFHEHLNVADSEGDTPLMWAAEIGSLGQAEILLKNGADFNLRNNDGETALDWAVKNGHTDVQALLDKWKNGIIVTDQIERCTNGTLPLTNLIDNSHL